MFTKAIYAARRVIMALEGIKGNVKNVETCEKCIIVLKRGKRSHARSSTTPRCLLLKILNCRASSSERNKVYNSIQIARVDGDINVNIAAVTDKISIICPNPVRVLVFQSVVIFINNLS